LGKYQTSSDSDYLTHNRAGGIKSNVGPLVAEQYASKKAYVNTSSDGRRVIIDPDITVQTIFSRYYWFFQKTPQSAKLTLARVMNIGSCSGLIATVTSLRSRL